MLHGQRTAAARWTCGTVALLALLSLRHLVLPPDWPFPFLPFVVGLPVVFALCGRGPGIAYLLASGAAALLMTSAPVAGKLELSIGYLLYLVQGSVVLWLLDRLKHLSLSSRAQEQLKDKMLSAQTDWVAQIDADGHFAYLNPAAEAAFGVSAGSGIGMSWNNVVLAEDLPVIVDRLAMLSPANPVVVIENRIPDGRGGVLWGHFVNRGSFDAQGKLLGILSVGRNVTERKLLERQLAELAKDYEDHYQHSPCAYFSLDADGLFIKVNDTLCEWLGRPATELVGRQHLTDFCTPEGIELFRTEYPRFMQSGAEMGIEFEIVHRDGSRRFVVVDANAVYDENGHYRYSRSVLTDISARKMAEAEVQRLNDALEQRVLERTKALRHLTEELESFTYSLSHDLRAPIRAINSGAAMLLEEEGQLTPSSLHEGLKKIRSSSERMAQLMDAMLALGALAAPAAPTLTFSHGTLVADALDTLLPANSPRRAQIRVNDLPEGHGNARRVQRVWENLLSNALKFTAHTPEPRIEVGFDADSRSFYVRDNGAGFDLRHANKILLPFERAHDGKQFEGAGIGLAIADKVVRREGGRIWFESAPGQGATFHFTLQGPEARSTP